MQEYAHRHLVEGTIEDEYGYCHTSEDWDDIDLLDQLERLARRVAKKDEVPLRVQAFRGNRTYFLTPFGKTMLILRDSIDLPFLRHQEHHIFNPYIAEVLNEFRRWNRSGGFHDLSRAMEPLAQEDAEALLRTADALRENCRSQIFKSKVDHDQKRARNNNHSACAYMANLFALHSRLLILRVDLYCRPDVNGFAYASEADRAFNKFTRALREDRVVPGITGWMSKREHGFRRGMHFHVLVAMNGHKYKDANGYAAQIGDYWKLECMKDGRGTYFNCYKNQHKYLYSGLGLVGLSDASKLTGLRFAIDYITKSKYQVKAGTGRQRNYRRGLAKHPKVKRGAPRKPEHNLAMVRTILDAKQIKLPGWWWRRPTGLTVRPDIHFTSLRQLRRECVVLDPPK